MDPLWQSVISHQFGAAMDMFENALSNCPDELWTARLWREGNQESAYSEFWYVAFHTLFFLDLYLSGSVEGFTPPPPFTLDELDPSGILPDRVYTRTELLSYLEHCRRKCRSTLADLSDERAREWCIFPWGKVVFAELLLDNMRHVQEHGAQLNLLIGQQKGANARWVTTRKDG